MTIEGGKTGRAVLAALAGVVLAVPVAAQEPAARVVTLPEVVELALEQNRDLRLARLEYEKASEQADEAWGRTMPQVDASARYTHNFSVPVQFIQAGDSLLEFRFGTTHSWSFGLDASQPLFDPAVIVGVGAASRFEAYQDEVVRGTAQQVITTARLRFYDVLLAEEAARLNRQSLARIQETLTETRAMWQAGLTSEYETLRLEVEASNVESDMRRAEDAVLAARRALAVELGLDPELPIRPAGALASLELEPGANEEPANQTVFMTAGVLEPEETSVTELIALARETRSELRQLELMEALRRAELRLERWSYLPKVSLFGTYQYSAVGDDFEFYGPLSSDALFGGVQVSLPLFAGFQRPARVAQREATVEQVRVQRDRALDQVESQLRTLHELVTEARRRADVQRRSVEQAQRGYRIASAEYREGIGSRLNVTDAEVALRRAEFNYAESVHEYLTARARIDEATGVFPDYE